MPGRLVVQALFVVAGVALHVSLSADLFLAGVATGPQAPVKVVQVVHDRQHGEFVVLVEGLGVTGSSYIVVAENARALRAIDPASSVGGDLCGYPFLEARRTDL